MRILVLNYEFPPVGGGGGQASADLCAALAARRHELRVLTSRIPGLPSREERDGYVVRRVFTGRRSSFRASFLAMAGYIVGALPAALQEIRSWRPQVLHAHFAVPTGALAFALSRLTGVPYLLTAHLGDVPGGVPEKTWRWFRAVYPLTPPIWRAAAAVVAVSEYTRGLALKHYSVPIEVIPNGVRLPEEGAGSVGDPPRLIFAGRFQPQKNLLFLAEALGRVADLPWRCTMFGDGPTRPAVEARLRELGLADRVAMPGWVSGESVWQALGESDLLVMPSRSEGLPVVGVHALARGVAIAATRAGGLAELVEDRVNGRVCDVGDQDGYAAALRWCLEDRDRLGALKRGSRELAARYDIRRVAQAYERALMKAAEAR